MLQSVLSKAPKIFPLAYSAYSHTSFLFHGNHIMESAEGVQQGDPLRPLLFCLTIHDLVCGLRSDFKAFYLDDGILGGCLDDIKADLLYIKSTGSPRSFAV